MVFPILSTLMYSRAHGGLMRPRICGIQKELESSNAQEFKYSRCKGIRSQSQASIDLTHIHDSKSSRSVGKKHPNKCTFMITENIFKGSPIDIVTRTVILAEWFCTRRVWTVMGAYQGETWGRCCR